MVPASFWPSISSNPLIQAHYEKCRDEGTAHTLAEMFALGATPQIRTDATFMEGHCNGNQFVGAEAVGDYYEKMAAEAGVNVVGKVYKSGLARFPGDPEAWVSGRGDVERIVRERGWGCEGSVSVKPDTSAVPIETIDVAPEVVEQKVMEMLDANPDLEHTSTPEEVFHEARELIKPYWSN